MFLCTYYSIYFKMSVCVCLKIYRTHYISKFFIYCTYLSIWHLLSYLFLISILLSLYIRVWLTTSSYFYWFKLNCLFPYILFPQEPSCQPIPESSGLRSSPTALLSSATSSSRTAGSICASLAIHTALIRWWWP